MTNRLTLVVVGEDRAPIELPQQGRLVIGAGERAHVQVVGQGVADVHCAIGRVKGGGWALQDLGSEFGTLRNGVRVEAAKLDAGDELLIGSRKLRVVDPLAPDVTPPKVVPAPPAAKPTTPAARAPEPARAPQPLPRTEAAEPERTPALGGYRVQDRLGRGAMGTVYLATQTSLDRPVALKVLSPKLASDPRFVERFQAEARAAAALNHPNVVTVYDVGSDAGQHYLAMEYMDAGSLEARLVERGPLPWREVLDCLRDAASGLVYAEQRRIVHRDIKPENLMRNGDGVTKIADLGLAVQIEAEAQNDDHLAEGRRIFGTPHFIAPEVVRGGTADSRSDLYSLGATAYRLLCGHTPFEGATTREILRGALNDPAPPLAERVPGLPAGVARLVHRMLEKDPAARFPSAQVTLDEIERLRRGETAAPVAGKPRSSLPLVVGGVAAFAVLAGAYFVFGGGDERPGSLTGPGRPTGPGPTPNDPGATTNVAGGITDVPEDPESDAGNTPGGATTTDEPPRPSEAEFELRAEVAFLQLRDQVLGESERIEALRALARDFAGTDTATRATAAADTLVAARAEVEQADAAKRARMGEVVTALRLAARLDARPFLPGRALREMRLVEGLADAVSEFGGDPNFDGPRSALVDEVLAAGADEARRLIAAADEAAGAGDFDTMAARLREVLPLGDLPAVDELAPLIVDGEPAGFAALRGFVLTANERLGNITGQRAELEARADAAARKAAADALGGGRAVEAELRSFALGAAAARVEAAASALGSADASSTAALLDLAADLRAGEALLRTLGTAWSTPGWKRRAFADPRVAGARPTSIEAIGADADGVLVDGGGTATRIPWSTWATQPRAIESLVNGRLDREWDAEEQRGVTTLLRVAAVLAAVDEAAEVLVADSGAKFSPGERDALLGGYEPARVAAEAAKANPALLAALGSEVAAAELLTDALRARSDGEWSRAAAALERLLDQHRTTLLVLVLSDGSTQ